jgi:signal transduction histidine kinase
LDQERTIAQQELINSLSWLIRLRWIAATAVIGLTFVITVGLRIDVPALPLYLIGGGLFIYNLILRRILRWIQLTHGSDRLHEWFALTQIGLDWAAMAILIHQSGGVCSPLLIFFMFHITIAALLLPHDRAFLYVALAPLLVTEVAVYEYYGLLRHVAVFEETLYRRPEYIVAVLFFFTCAVYVMAYVSITISRRLRRREEEITGVYESVRTTTSTLDLDQVLNRLTQATARALKCKAASIRLLNPSGSHLVMMASFGLSHSYLTHASVPLASAVIDREALSGKTVLIADAAHDERVRYPDQLREEGIESILSTPLIGKQGLIGVLRAYGGKGHRFGLDDANFVAAVAAHGAVAIENAQAYGVLRDLDRQKSQFVRMVTHELRSPVQVAQNLVGVLANEYLGDLSPKQTDVIGRIQRRLQYLRNLVDDLLNLAAAKADVLTHPERSRVKLTDIFKDLYDRFEAAAKAKGIKLILESAEPSIAIWGLRDELDTLFGNLLDNAIKYTEHGMACVRVGLEDEAVRVDVSDTGIGIPEIAIPRVFDEFFRAENAKDFEERGTGLGLAIVKGLVDRYEGRIEVQSRENQGTTFTVWLPTVPPA